MSIFMVILYLWMSHEGCWKDTKVNFCHQFSLLWINGKKKSVPILGADIEAAQARLWLYQMYGSLEGKKN